MQSIHKPPIVNAQSTCRFGQVWSGSVRFGQARSGSGRLVTSQTRLPANVSESDQNTLNRPVFEIEFFRY